MTEKELTNNLQHLADCQADIIRTLKSCEPVDEAEIAHYKEMEDTVRAAIRRIKKGRRNDL